MPGPDIKPAARVSPDRRSVAFLAIGLAAVIMLASYVFSFTAIAGAAAWTGVPAWAQWLAAIFIDGAIVTYTLSLAILRWRGESVTRTMIFLYSFTSISVVVNFAHAGSAQQWDFSRLETWFAALIGISAPVAALFAADETTRLVFTREPETAHTAIEQEAEPPAEPEHEPDPQPDPPAADPEPESRWIAPVLEAPRTA